MIGDEECELEIESWQKAALLAVFCAACGGFGARAAQAAPYYVTVAGLGGEPDYEQRFTALAKDLDKLFKAAASDAHVYTFTGSDATKAHLTDTLGQIAREAKPEDEFTLILIGHGSYDGEVYKFNLPGPDISGEDLAILCDRIPAKRQLIVNTTSASGGSIGALQKAGRIVIAATKTGTEKNATVFARYWVDALRDGSADTDKNEAISALEAFQLRRSQDGRILRIAKAAGDGACRVRGHRQEGSAFAPLRRKTEKGCWPRISFCCESARRKRPRTIRPSARCSIRRKSSNARSIC